MQSSKRRLGASRHQSCALNYGRVPKALFAAELKPTPGIVEFLETLDANRCVASSSDRERVCFSLEVAGLIRFFDDKLFSSQQVARSKPSPDIYIYAAEKMGVTPEVALVIEDSIPGVIAACAAGATVIFLRHRKPGARQQRHALNLAGSTACRNAIDSGTLV